MGRLPSHTLQTPDGCPSIPADWFDVSREDFERVYELSFDTFSPAAQRQVGRIALSNREFISRYFSDEEIERAIILSRNQTE